MHFPPAMPASIVNTPAPGDPVELTEPAMGWLRIVWRVVLAAAILWLGVVFVSPELGPGAPARVGLPPAWGWDETMHAELPAVQMLLHAENGDWSEVMEVVHDCDRYPFLYPAFLAGWQGVLGISQPTARSLGYVFYFLLVGLAIRLGLQAVQTNRSRGPAVEAALLVGLAAISAPLARRYAPTLFLEVPALVMIALALTTWISRRGKSKGTRARLALDLLTGLFIAATFFTKFNYALLLGVALFLDASIELARSRDRRATAFSLVWTGAPLAFGLAWWFLLPLPLGAEVAAEHRGDFMEFVTGNTEMTMAWWLRLTNWLTGVAAHSFVFGALCLFSLGALATHRTRTTLTLGLALVAFVLPIVLHPFQLDRFLLPAGLILWVLGGAGAALALHRAPVLFTAGALALGALCVMVPVFTTTAWVGFPVAKEGTANREFQEFHVGKTLSLFGPPASNGLTREVHGQIMDLIAGGVGPEDSVGWLGQSAEISPATLHLGLLGRGGSKERFLKYAEGPLDIELLPSNVRVDFTQGELLDYARQFDHIVVPNVGDLMGRGGRAWIPEAWYAPLRQSPETQWTTLGTVLVDRSIRGPLPVTLELMHVLRNE